MLWTLNSDRGRYAPPANFSAQPPCGKLAFARDERVRRPGDVLRGGSWNNNENNVRTANRNRNDPSNTNNNVGFRCSRPLPARMCRDLPQREIPARVPGKRAPVLPVIPPGEVANIQKPGCLSLAGLQPGNNVLYSVVSFVVKRTIEGKPALTRAGVFPFYRQ